MTASATLSGPKLQTWAPCKFIVVALIAVLSLSIAWSTGFDKIGDHLFLSNLASGHPIKVSDTSAESALRFVPLNGTPYNLLLLLVRKVSPFSLHLWNALEFLILCLVIHKVLSSQANWLLVYLSTLAFVIQPSLLTASNRLLVPERTLVLGTFVMLYFYKSYLKNKTIVAFCACLLSANWAIYSKEPVSGAVIVFACSQILARLKSGRAKETHALALDISLLTSGLTFITIYLGIIWSSHAESYSTTHRFLPWALNVSQNIRDYSLYSDPFVFFIGIPLASVRVVSLIKKREDTVGWEDSALFAGVAYACAILALNMSYTSYYLLPASALAWPAMVSFIQRSAEPNSLGVRFSDCCRNRSLCRPHPDLWRVFSSPSCY